MGDFWLARIFLGLLPVQEFFFFDFSAVYEFFFLIKSASYTFCYLKQCFFDLLNT